MARRIALENRSIAICRLNYTLGTGRMNDQYRGDISAVIMNFEAAALEEMGMATRNAVPLREGRVLERLLILP